MRLLSWFSVTREENFMRKEEEERGRKRKKGEERGRKRKKEEERGRKRKREATRQMSDKWRGSRKQGGVPASFVGHLDLRPGVCQRGGSFLPAFRRDAVGAELFILGVNDGGSKNRSGHRCRPLNRRFSDPTDAAPA
ncbi:hypothetical protein fugu_014369 [Takifugu bimaculatus]|uniref:Uncharacterized protein n=1 Tax=Takifugu bimaculatus TaxID=433685 RepID=A0A4Z2C146_9TELE|nr:hypothetical protein fugu_014369 [Takifugu bimaculatus]